MIHEKPDYKIYKFRWKKSKIQKASDEFKKSKKFGFSLGWKNHGLNRKIINSLKNPKLVKFIISMGKIKNSFKSKIDD